jgi:hypothetical protein
LHIRSTQTLQTLHAHLICFQRAGHMCHTF